MHLTALRMRRRITSCVIISILSVFMFTIFTVLQFYQKNGIGNRGRYMRILHQKEEIPNLPFCSQVNGTEKWDFQCRVKCPKFNISDIQKPRQQVELQCSRGQATLVMREVVNIWTVPQFTFNDTCLADVIESHCYNGRTVPNVAHYIIFNKQPLEFYNLLSIYSIYQKLKPCLIIIQSDFQMFGKYWNYLLHLVPNMIQILRDPPQHIFGQDLLKVEHKSDWARLQTIEAFGGIYCDMDLVLLQDLEKFRSSPLTLGMENKYSLSNAVIIAEKNPKFIEIWKEAYATFDPNGWGEHSILLPLKLSRMFPHLVNVENTTTFLKPFDDSGNQIFEHNFDWSKSHGIHLYIRNYKSLYGSNIDDLYNPEISRFLNTTIGAVTRYILFGSKDLCSE